MYRTTSSLNSNNIDEKSSRNNLNQDIPEYGSAFVCGKSRFEAEKFHVKNDPIVSISCGDEHTGVVTETGRVFMFGSNNWGQLGLGHENNVDKPSCIKSMKHEKVKLICCGRNHTILATESGYLYSFGCNSESQLGLDKTDSFFNAPQKISLPSINWKMLSAGAGHTCALADDGSLYVWGINDNGELGIGSITEQPVPKKLDLGFRIRFVSCGYYHTAIISKSGKLLTAGSNEYFQLGRERNEKKFNEVEGIQDYVKYVSCGGGHTLFATEDGLTYAIGDGTKGQLGLGPDLLKTKYPKRIKALEKFSIAKISSGECHSAFITNKGEILTCGDNRYGKLGLNQKLFNSIQFQPILVEKYQDLDVKLVACGGCHMILVGFLIANNLSDANDDDEENYLSNKYSKSKNFLKQKPENEYSSRGNNENLSARGTDKRSARRHSDSDEDRNPEMEYTFNRTHTLTKDDRFVPLSQTDLRKYARDDYADQFKSKKNSDYSKNDRFNTSSLNTSTKLKKSKYSSESSSNESLEEQRYSSRTHTNNTKNDTFNKFNRNTNYKNNDDDEDEYNYKSRSERGYAYNKNKKNYDDDNDNRRNETENSSRSPNKKDKEETPKKKPFKICTIL